MARIHVHPASVSHTPTNVAMQGAPYPLGCLVAYAKAEGSGRLLEHFEFNPITPRYSDDAISYFDTLAEPGIFLFSSYVWNHAANVLVANRVKEKFPEAFVIFGGPQVPRERRALAEFFQKTGCVDLVVRGEGEEALAEVLSVIAGTGASVEALHTVDFSGVPGVTYRRTGLVETPDRARPKSLEAFPSPYTTGLFDHWLEGVSFMPLETNRGCPYGCTFCDWGASTLAKIRVFDIERVFGEIEHLGARHVQALFIADANFGILKRDVDIAERLVQVRERTGFPHILNYSNAKVVRPGLQSIISMFRAAGLNAVGQVAMQTTDERVLEIVKRSNIKTSEYDKLVQFFRKENIPAFSDMMVGLPGANLSTCKKDLQFLFDRRIHAHVFPTMVMPNAPMADPEYRERYAIRIDADGFVLSTASFTAEEYGRMVDLCYTYKLLGNFGTGIFKYLLLFMQLDLGVRALDFVEAWLKLVTAEDGRFPASSRLYEQVLRQDNQLRGRDIAMLKWDSLAGEAVLGSIDSLLREALEMASAVFGIRTTGSDVEAVITAQKAVLPNPHSTIGEVVTPHDVAAYFGLIATCVSLEAPPPELRPLREYGPGTVQVLQSRQDLDYNDAMAPFFRLELSSNLAC